MEEDEYIGTRISSRAWCDLPPELLREIANSLGLFDLLAFRGVCKDWRSASFTASAPIESARDTKPCFLLHNDRDEKTILFNPTTNKNYNINIPELKEATCLASTQGWLLVSQKGHVFFFCPFSRAKIVLPPLQESEISPGAAVFTSPPSSIDCVTAIIYKKNDHVLELNVLERGVSSWMKYEYDLKLKQRNFGVVKGATSHDGCFYIMDDKNELLTFTLEDKSFEIYRIVNASKDPNVVSLPFRIKDKCFNSSDLKKQMKLGDDVTISTCASSYFGSDSEIVIKNENIEAMEGSEAQHFKGIWIQPRFFQLPPNYSWSL
ncbi:F-box protein At4g00893-like isoform X2 [Lycium barbarum]|uniref:F-box protein At4g00893-like isoform X2 n=1 Tax=Lycium barbarum TaxID=112863 RepID=UPI00293F72D9|nr:F-box protein At4g00893-like isoform X2 [Lycium barbarum]